uniref:Odorant-binding protein 29 n=1 Tax=Propsilocerus akamusi TaxID=903466 RepID=A0A7D0P9S5_9DIPT|nr:odorant-binding protein 29 [Propsilocerus akamusi]
MKVFIAIFALIAVTSAEFQVQTSEDLQKYRVECATENNIPAESIEHYKEWKFEDAHAACYINCVFRKMQLYDNDSGFLVDNLVAQLTHGKPDGIRASVEKCTETTETDNCQKAFKGFVCFSKSNLGLIQQSVKKD